MSLLSFHEVHAQYGDARILNGVTFDIAASERVALVGRNGVGKTTVVNALCGVASVARGHISINGHRMRDLRRHTAAKNGIAIVLQGRGILPNLTVQENLLLGMATGRAGPWSSETVHALFPILKERAGSLGGTLSGGQQQMLAIGRALMANPQLLILDEPSEGLAPIIVDELAELLVRLGSDGMGILLIEQSVGLIRRVAERFYVLSKGSIAASGEMATIAPDEFKRHIAI